MSGPAEGARWNSHARYLEWLLGLTLLMQISCSSAPMNVLEAGTTQGSPVQELIADDRPSVILHYPASYCFSCGQSVAEWQELDRTGQVKLLILLTSEPSPGTRRSLALRRIRISGIVELTNSEQVPREYLVEGGEVKITARGAAETGRNSPVLAAIRNRGRHSAGKWADTAAAPSSAQQ